MQIAQTKVSLEHSIHLEQKDAMTQSILITGCSSGIGYCAATSLKKRGYRVFAAARKLADVEKLSHLGLEAVQIDINDSASIQQGLEQVLKATGGTLDALFNNAGFLQAGAIEDLSRNMLRAQFETNVFGPMELISLVLPVMRKQGHGRIIQNSSILGIITLPYYGAYNASKFALEGFTNTLRQELHGSNIFVSSINPGPIYSDLRDKGYSHYKEGVGRNKEHSAHSAAYARLEESYFNTKDRKDGVTNGPEAVVKQLIHALENRKPRAHYYIGKGAQMMAMLRRLLPDPALDWVTKKIGASS